MFHFSLTNRLYLVVLLCFASIILLIDSVIPNGVAIGFLYTFLILFASFLISDHRIVILYAFLCIFLIVVGFFLAGSPSPPLSWMAIFNRALSMVGVVSVAYAFGISHGKLEDQKNALDQFAIVSETDDKGRITYVNNKFCEISKYSRNELIGQNYRLLNSDYHPKEFWKNFWTIIRSGKIWRGDVKNRTKDGNEYWVDTTVVPSLGFHGKPDKYLAIRTDITNRKETEKQLKEKTEHLLKINKELGDFSYIISHDLKAPLRGIGSVADWIHADYIDKLDDEGKENLEALRNRVKRMSKLIDGILHYSRIGRDKEEMQMINLDSLVKNSVDLLNAPDNIVISIGHPLPQICGVSVQLEQVFQNLLSNAIRYMDKENGKILINCVKEPNFWRFSITDNGPGIEEEHFERIFKIFQTLASRDKIESTGIGLTIVKKIIERHKGKVWLESKIGEGSTFHFTLPVNSPSTKEAIT